ncbi:MAG TPA: plastocyanin/azurin family copper-binding protein [Acidimicrobiia bacterium]|nr:plastocyanin/azurin family copper-binding protein [Acidimicrobiia bacterium]
MTDTDTIESTDAPSGAPAPPAEPERVPFWHRPYVERFLVPLLLPIVVVVGLVVYILNISRLFLSGHGHIPVIVGTVITLIILLGSGILAKLAPRAKQSAMTIVSVAFIFLILMGGWLVLGHSQEKNLGPATLPATLKTKQQSNVTAAPGGALAFAPSTLNATTGLDKINVKVATGGHTFTFESSETMFETLQLNTAGETVSGVALFPHEGTYTFYCTIPGHREAGMTGVIKVTGPTVTLSQALTAAGNPPTVSG